MNDTIKRYSASALAALLIALFLIFAATPQANACSCIRPDPSRDLGSSAAAFVGELVDIVPASESEFGPTNALTFVVIEWVKADLGDVVTIISSESSASCGIVMKPGDVLGIMASLNASGRLASSMCQAVEAEVLSGAIFEGQPSSSVPAVTIEDLADGLAKLSGEPSPLFTEPTRGSTDEGLPVDALPNVPGFNDTARPLTSSGAVSPLVLIGGLIAIGASGLYVLDRRSAKRNTKDIW